MKCQKEFSVTVSSSMAVMHEVSLAMNLRCQSLLWLVCLCKNRVWHQVKISVTNSLYAVNAKLFFKAAGNIWTISSAFFSYVFVLMIFRSWPGCNINIYWYFNNKILNRSWGKIILALHSCRSLCCCCFVLFLHCVFFYFLFFAVGFWIYRVLNL